MNREIEQLASDVKTVPEYDTDEVECMNMGDDQILVKRLLAVIYQTRDVLKEIMSWEENEQMTWANKARQSIAACEQVLGEEKS